MVLDFSLLIFSSILVRKIYRLIGTNDLPMLLSIVSITLALLCFLGYCVLSVTQAILKQTIDDHVLNSDNGDNILTAVDEFKVMFTLCAFVLDLYKWCLFIIASGFNRLTSDTKKQQDLLTKVLVVVELVMIISTLVLLIGLLSTEGGT